EHALHRVRLLARVPQIAGRVADDEGRAGVRGHLGEETYTTAFEEGAGLTPETARDQAASPAARPTAGSRPPGSGPTGTHTPR
ncbi:hypothetical protein ABT039_36890, partial [Streptomyces lasiicapitis]|uniref:hypothetical protein n=1 Tax=Streptomyces lasiicapitis TaxID=1923961 RepID=UPI0033255C56